MKYFFNVLIMLSLTACAVSELPNKEKATKVGKLALPQGQIVDWPLPDFDCTQCSISKKQTYLPQGIEHELLAESKNNKKVFVISSKRAKKKVKDVIFKIIGKNELEVCYESNCQLTQPMRLLTLNACEFIISDVYYDVEYGDNIKDGNQVEFTVNGLCLD